LTLPVNKVYYFTFTVLFLATAPLLLTVRFFRPRRMPWWLLVVLAGFFGWAFANLFVYFNHRHLGDLIAAAGGVNGAPQELLDRWTNDGAKRVFANMFGWAYGLAYLLPSLGVYLMAILWRSRRER
jgi:drug/metabolite transporter (DMT)-like permease